MLRRIIANKKRIGLCFAAGAVIYKVVADAFNIWNNPWSPHYRLTAIWNRYNPYYPIHLVKNSTIFGCRMRFRDNNEIYLSTFSQFVPVTPQLIFMMLKSETAVDEYSKLFSRLFWFFKTPTFWLRCMQLNPNVYPLIPSEHKTKEMTEMYMNNLTTGEHFNIFTIPEKHITNDVLTRAKNHDERFNDAEFNKPHIGALIKEFIMNYNWKRRTGDQVKEIIIRDDQLNDFWWNLLRDSHSYRHLLPHAPKEVQDKILEEIKDFNFYKDLL